MKFGQNGKWRIAGLAACALISIGLAVAWTAWRRPLLNVVIITLDTTRADHLHCYGDSQALTPVLDGLAARGVLFERAYATAPLTLPSHASMFTGLYPPEHGLLTNGKSGLGKDVPVLAEVLRKRGYTSGAFIASFVLDAKFGLNRGFDTYDDDLTGTTPMDEALHRNRDGDRVVDAALKWLDRHWQRPFLCWVHLYDPHAPYRDHPELFGDRFRDRPYDAEIAFVDLQIGRVLEFLKSRQLEQRTLVVVVGDHGEGLGEHQERRHGQMLYNSTLHVPLILSRPGEFPAGRRIADPVSLIDLTPTILDSLRLRLKGPISGRSLRPLVNGQNPEPRVCYAATDDCFLESGWSPLRSLTTAHWKYIRTTRAELYDLEHDPAETHNLAAIQSAQLELLEQQLAELESTMYKRQGSTVQLSQEDQQRLVSLGYAGNQHGRSRHASESGLPDIKDMILHANSQEDARELIDAGKFDQAEKILKKLVATVPDFELAQIALGDIHIKRREFEQATAVYLGVLKRNPESTLAQIHLGDILDAQGQFAEAVAHYQQALQTEPDSAKLHYNLGRALVQMGHNGEAIPHFATAVQLDPGYVFANIELGTALFREGNPDQALSHLHTALRYDPNSVFAHMNAAMVLAQQGRLAKALEHLEQASKISPADPEIQYQLGAFLARMGEFERAAIHLSEAVRLQPGHKPAGELLGKIQARGRTGK